MTSADDDSFWHIHDAPRQQPQTTRSSPDLPMTAPDSDHDIDLLNHLGHVTKDLDQLVHWLDAKPILQDRSRQHFEDRRAEGEEREGRRIEGSGSQSRGSAAFPTQISIQSRSSEPTPALDPRPALSTQCAPCSLMPSLHHSPQSLGPRDLEREVANTTFDDNYAPNPSDPKQSRRGTDTRLRSASNARVLDLVTGMIENGVQCNVQNPTPSSPNRKWSTSSALAAAHRYFDPQPAIDSLPPPDNIELEVDMTASKPDDETSFNDNVTLRFVSSPAGIRKFGILRYRSSAEAAQSCKHMKKNVPRMRRRRRRASVTAPRAEPSSSQPSAEAQLYNCFT
ncbi:hypothetical protein F4861DRAFT_133461 [Xylaria intraflava]|nr:hypothetical protein F4861DRAFT_133461 [Xylaria intraflava]